jgi:hypothetical protein
MCFDRFVCLEIMLLQQFPVFSPDPELLIRLVLDRAVSYIHSYSSPRWTLRRA